MAYEALRRNVMHRNEKIEALKRLAHKRTLLKRAGYSQPEDFFGYDFRLFVSPISKGAYNVDAEYFFVLQDWSSAGKLTCQGFDVDVAGLGRDPKLRTNRKLSRLLSDALGLTFADIYATNAFP